MIPANSINPNGLKDYQVPHVKALVDSLYLNKLACDLSDTGVGKTYCGAGVAREMNLPVFVICPKIVVPTWNTLLKDFGVSTVATLNYELLSRGNTPYLKWNKNIEKEWECNFKKIPSNALVIFDEVHKAKGMESLNSQMVFASKRQGFKLLVISASVATNPLEMFSFGFITGLHTETNHNKFKKNFCAMNGCEWTGRFGTMTFDNETPKAQQAMMKINDYLFNQKKIASRISIADLGDKFPDNEIEADTYGMGQNTEKINKAYHMMEAELAMLEEKSKNYSEHIFAIMMKTRRTVELLKLPTIIELVEDFYIEGKAIVLFTNFNDSADVLVNKLGKLYGADQVAVIRGGQSQKVRQENIAAFQADQKRIIVVNIAAGGVGVSLHDLNGNHPRISLICPTWSAIQMIQAIGRVWRQGALSKSIQKIVYAAGTLEEAICNRVRAKLNNLAALNDGDVDVSLMKF